MPRRPLLILSAALTAIGWALALSSAAPAAAHLNFPGFLLVVLGFFLLDRATQPHGNGFAWPVGTALWAFRLGLVLAVVNIVVSEPWLALAALLIILAALARPYATAYRRAWDLPAEPTDPS